ERLTDFTWKIRQALRRSGMTFQPSPPWGEGGVRGEIDHIELFGPSRNADSRNFVLCPGNTYDRSPCGTGTSAKLACLVADGKLKEGQVWRQESIIGSVFEGRASVIDNVVHPGIKGAAFITAESDLIFDERDPFLMGIRK